MMRLVLAIIAGVVVGSIVNMGLVLLGGQVVPPPDGVDPANVDSIKNSIASYEGKHFVFPFLAHAVGTLVGAITAYLIAVEHKMLASLTIGGVFLIGGISMANMIPQPTWFTILDLVFAYIPMGFLGGLIAKKLKA